MESYFPNQGLNPHPLHWKVKSYSLDCQGSPRDVYLYRETLDKNWKDLHQINHNNHCWAKENESRLWVMVQFSSVQLLSCVAMNCNMPGFPVHHQLPELAQTHVHRVGDAIQPSHPQSSPSPAFNLSPNEGLFQLVSFSHHMAKELQIQHQTLFPLRLTGLISLQSKGLSRAFSNTTVQKHQFFSTQLSLWFNTHIHT